MCYTSPALMERLTHLIDTFRADYPAADPDILMEFAQHVRRVLIDEVREELKEANTPVALSMQVHGCAFSAKGPRGYVESLLQHFEERASAPPGKNITPGFNRIKLISGRSR